MEEPLHAMRVGGAVHPLEVSWSRRSEIADRAPRLPGCDQDREKNISHSQSSLFDNPRFPYAPHTRQLHPPPLLGQATEYLSPSPQSQSGSPEPDNAAAARPPHTTCPDCHRVHDILLAIVNPSHHQPLTESQPLPERTSRTGGRGNYIYRFPRNPLHVVHPVALLAPAARAAFHNHPSRIPVFILTNPLQVPREAIPGLDFRPSHDIQNPAPMENV